MSGSSGTEIELRALRDLADRISGLNLPKDAPPEFNVFEAVGVVFQEARHSDFLAFLLDPRAHHGLGDRFAKGWLKRTFTSARSDIHGSEDLPAPGVGPDLLERLDRIDMSGAQVRRERHRIDVLLVDPTNRLTVVVENKIFSGEHSDQLARYLRIVEDRYPGYVHLCVYLTPNGEAPSHSRYVGADYAGVCEEVEAILGEDALPDGVRMDNEVRFALSHYARLLRRNVVANSETLDLARRLYLEHRSAFELVYAHRYAHQKRLRGVLIGLIEETRGLVYRHRSGAPPEEWVLFHPEEWDVPALRCAREDYAGSSALVLSFVFDNYVDGLGLKLEFGPGDDEVRRRLLEMAHGDPELFAAAPPAPDPTWVTALWRMPLLTQEEYLEVTYSGLERLLRERWDGFLDGPFRQLSETVRRQGWT